MISSLPAAAVNMIQNGQMPTLNVPTIFLSKGEVCHYVDKACLMTKKVTKHYRKRYGGSSFKIAKGWYYRTGTSYSIPIENSKPVYTPGYLYITNQRLIFTARMNGFDRDFSTLTAVIPDSDSIELQFGSKNLIILSPTALIAVRTIQMLKP
jgi:hypothetical protein